MTTKSYRGSALLTDLYQVTMAYAYWKTGTAAKEAAFSLFFRELPFKGGFAVTAGLEDAVAWLRDLTFTRDDLHYLAGLCGNDGAPLFDAGFLKYLGKFRFTCDVDAVPEGTVVFPHEPLLRIKGPIVQAQIVETALLNFINFQTLIATKAARICLAAAGEPVLEFGLRRAQGVDGGLAASRAAFIGGCAATSNLLAGRIFGIPVRGTQAHSWVMSFDEEGEAFRAFAEAMPNNCVFVVDTYDTLKGVSNAIEVGRSLTARGKKMAGVRLDSGDLAALSIRARRMLDKAGLPNAVIIASNDLDEHEIERLRRRGAKIGVWGVGTRLVTAYDQPSLGGVYKLSAVRRKSGPWSYRMKVSDQSAKVSNPGILQVRRFFKGGEFLGDMIYNEALPGRGSRDLVDPRARSRRLHMPADAAFEDLLEPVFREGTLVRADPSLPSIRARAQRQLAHLAPAVKRLVGSVDYPVGLEPGLFELRTKLAGGGRGNRLIGPRRRAA